MWRLSNQKENNKQKKNGKKHQNHGTVLTIHHPIQFGRTTTTTRTREKNTVTFTIFPQLVFVFVYLLDGTFRTHETKSAVLRIASGERTHSQQRTALALTFIHIHAKYCNANSWHIWYNIYMVEYVVCGDDKKKGNKKWRAEKKHHEKEMSRKRRRERARVQKKHHCWLLFVGVYYTISFQLPPPFNSLAFAFLVNGLFSDEHLLTTHSTFSLRCLYWLVNI